MAKDNNKRGYEEAFGQNITETTKFPKNLELVYDFKEKSEYWRDFFQKTKVLSDKFDVRLSEKWNKFVIFMIDNIKSEDINEEFSLDQELNKLLKIMGFYDFGNKILDLLDKSLEEKIFI